MFNPKIRLIVGAICALFGVGYSAAQTKTTTYTYDALGRLTFVEDSQNGNRDYDYDAAGNRLNVSVGNAVDEVTPPTPQIPAVPANRSKNYVNDCAWRASWTLSSGATSYSLKNTLNQITTIYPQTSSGNPTVQIVGSTISVTTNCPQGQPESNEPGQVKACGPDGCSAYGAF